LLKRIKVKSIAHITGGGFYDNIPRVLPEGRSALIYKELWPMPEVFKIIQKKARIDTKEMYSTFNMGIGMILVVPKNDAARACGILNRFKLDSYVIGEILEGDREVII